MDNVNHSPDCPRPPVVVRDELTRHRDLVQWCGGCCRHGLVPTTVPEPPPLPAVAECLTCAATFTHTNAAVRHAAVRGHEVARVRFRPFPHPEDCEDQ